MEFSEEKLSLPAGVLRLLPGARPRVAVLKRGKHKSLYLLSAGDTAYFVKEYVSLPPARWWQAGREARLMRRVALRGVPVLLPDAVQSFRTRGWLAFRRLVGAERLQVILETTWRFAERRAILLEYARFCRKVHDAGVYQYDFNPTNVLRTPDGRLFQIDFERASLRKHIPWRIRLEQLAGLNRFPGASGSERLFFLRSYLGSGNWKPIARKILALYRTKAEETRRRHRPRGSSR